MAINTNENSDSDFWYLRGFENLESITRKLRVDNNVKFTQYQTQRIPTVVGTKAENSAISDIKYQHGGLYFVVFVDEQDAVYIYRNLDSLPIFRLQFRYRKICALHVNEFFLRLLDSQSNSILLINRFSFSAKLNDAENELAHDIDDRTFEIKEGEYEQIKVEGAEIDQNSQFDIVHGGTITRDVVFLLWGENGNSAFLLSFEQENSLIAHCTDFDLPKHVFDSLRISSIDLYGKKVFMGCSTGRIYSLSFEQKRLKAKTFVGDGVQKVDLNKGRFCSPLSLCVFSLQRTLPEKLNKGFGIALKSLNDMYQDGCSGQVILDTFIDN
jgi:hypothetical protein